VVYEEFFDRGINFSGVVYRGSDFLKAEYFRVQFLKPDICNDLECMILFLNYLGELINLRGIW
jgi:hypothetical protein